MDRHTAMFEAHRAQLEGLAYRMLGGLDDARDVVQDTWLRWREVEVDAVRDPRAWLMTTCSRRAMDVLRAAHVRRAAYEGPWLPEPWVEPAADAHAEVDDSVSIALLVALERLTPAERASFLLHDVFGYSFDEVAGVLERSAEAARQLASRARAHVAAARPRFSVSPDEHRRLLDAFLAAARAGDVEGLKALMCPSVELTSDGGGKAQALHDVLCGVGEVSAFLARVWSTVPAATRVVLARYNGAPGIVALEDGRAVTALSFELAEGRIARIFAHRNPDKLAALIPTA